MLDRALIAGWVLLLGSAFAYAPLWRRLDPERLAFADSFAPLVEGALYVKSPHPDYKRQRIVTWIATRSRWLYQRSGRFLIGLAVLGALTHALLAEVPRAERLRREVARSLLLSALPASMLLYWACCPTAWGGLNSFTDVLLLPLDPETGAWRRRVAPGSLGVAVVLAVLAYRLRTRPDPSRGTRAAGPASAPAPPAAPVDRRCSREA